MGRSSRRTRAVAAGVASLALLTAAAGTSAASGGEGTTPDSTAAADVDRDASFSFAYSTGHTSFDPHMTPSSADQIFLRQVYDSLLTLGRDESGAVTPVPQLATAWEFSEDGLTLQLSLRDDVTFQDGEPFNAEAVKANLERAMGPDSTVSSYLPTVESVEAVDDTTVMVNLSSRDAALPWNLATQGVGMMVSPAAFESDLSATPVGSGPFQLVSAQRDAEVVFERWDDHWNPDAALVAEFRLLTVPDGNARYNSVQTGDVDATFLASPLDAESQALEEEGYHWIHAVSPVTVGLAMNSDMPPFDDVRVRQAMNIAVNRQELSENLLNGINPPAYQPITEGFFGHNPELDVDPYDPEAARALLEEAGAIGAQVEIIQPTTEPQSQIALVVQQVMQDLGLEVELVPISPTDARTVWREGNHQAIVMPIIAQFEPSQTLTTSYIDLDNPATPPAELLELTDAAAALPAGSEEQEAAYQEVERYLVENPVHANYVNFSTVILARPEVVNSDRMILTGIAEFNMRGVGIGTT